MSEINVQMDEQEAIACVELLLMNDNHLPNAAESACYIANIGNVNVDEFREDITNLLKQIAPIVRIVTETLSTIRP